MANKLAKPKTKNGAQLQNTRPTGSKRAGSALLVRLDRTSGTPVFRQIYNEIRQAILSGRLAARMRLPPTRALADDLGTARMTVVLAYEHLETEGYVVGKGSAGTFVADLILPPNDPKVEHIYESSPAVESIYTSIRPEPVPFRIGEPALDAFPIKLWSRLYSRSLRLRGKSLAGYGDSTGYLPLRRAIARHMSVSRNVRGTSEQVILVRGAQQAMDLVARALLEPGDQVWVEDPGYLVVRDLVTLAGAIPVPVPVDDKGLVIEEGIRFAPDAKMVCIAPSHQFPLGSTLSLARRLALLDWASRSSAWVVEDDFDSEFRYDGAPIMSLQGLDTAGRVIYVGTFSKTVFPSLRLGYLIVPPELVERFRSLASLTDYISPTVEQATLTEFIDEGHFARHVRRMRALYSERHDALLSAAKRSLRGLLRLEPAHTGMHVIGWLSASGANEMDVTIKARKRGVEVRPLSRYCLRAQLPPGLILGFAAVPAPELINGIDALKNALLSQN